MKLFRILVSSLLLNVALLMNVATVSAETPFETLVRFRQDYPAHMTAPQHGELLNRLAWFHKDSGMKLLGKASGNNCPTPEAVFISCDYIVWTQDAPKYSGFDILSGRDDGTTDVVAFTWGPGKEDLQGAIASGARTLVEPTLPDNGGPVTPDPTDPTEPNPGTTLPNPGLTLLQQTLNEFRQEFHEEVIRAEEERAAQRAFRTEVGIQWGKVTKFVAKYGTIIAGAVLGGRLLGGGSGE